jgi:hypothetical protein
MALFPQGVMFCGKNAGGGAVMRGDNPGQLVDHPDFYSW